MRSVNQRYLKLTFVCRSSSVALNLSFASVFLSRLTRGKVECTLRYEPDVSAQGELILNEKLAKQLVTAANWVKMQSDSEKSTRLIFSRWPGRDVQEQDLDAIAAEIPRR